MNKHYDDCEVIDTITVKNESVKCTSLLPYNDRTGLTVTAGTSCSEARPNGVTFIKLWDEAASKTDVAVEHFDERDWYGGIKAVELRIQGIDKTTSLVEALERITAYLRKQIGTK